MTDMPKPCPCCGAEARENDGVVYCESAYCSLVADSIEDWNRRIPDPSVEALADALGDLLVPHGASGRGLTSRERLAVEKNSRRVLATYRAAHPKAKAGA